MSDQDTKVRVEMFLPSKLVAQVEDWRARNKDVSGKMPTRTAAIQELVTRALESSK